VTSEIEKPRPDLSHLVVSHAFDHRPLVRKYGGEWSGEPRKIWRIPVIDGYVIDSTSGECRDPYGLAEYLRGLGCKVLHAKKRQNAEGNRGR